MNRIERADYTNSTTSLTTTLCVYRSDWGDPIYRGQVFAITTPDGVRKAYAYETGTWSSGAFTAGSGTASRISEITGSSNSSAGSSMTSHNSKTIEQVYVVDGKSTLVTTVRDSQARLVRRETAVRSSSAWQTTGWTNFTYDMAGHLTNRSSSNGATYEATYTGGLKTNETDEQGVVTDYTYDSGDRLETVTREGSGVIGTLVYKYTYDAAGNRTEERLGYGQSEQIITAAQFDDAGRLTSITPPGLGATTHSYNVSARTHTITRADSATLIETANLDGELASVTGTAVVPQYRTYAIESDGSRYSQVNSGTTSSARWLKKWTNWMGRGIKQEHPGFTGQDNMVEQYFYDSVGRLSKSTRSGYAARLFEYGSLSNLYRSGLDIDGNNVLDLASSDRITETNTYLESYSSAYWLRTDTKVYARLSLNTVFTTDISRVRLTQHASNRLAEAQQIDAESNTRTAQYEVNRLARTATTTETHSGLSGSRTSSFVNGILRSTTSFDGLTTTLGYDSLLRFSTNTDSRSNTTTVAYASGTARASTVTDASSAQQAFTYDNVGRLTSQRDTRNFYTRFAYNNRNQITRQWGDGAYPVEYGYFDRLEMEHDQPREI